MKNNLLKYKNHYPIIGNNVLLAKGSIIIGDVVIGDNSSIWYNCVLRGDVNRIIIGKGINLQDSSVIHVDHNEKGETIIGDNVTIGHQVLLHACKIESNAFVGMGSVIMDHARMEEFSMLAAGSLLTKNKIIKSGELWAGRPAKFLRLLSDEEKQGIIDSAIFYQNLSKDHIPINQ
ncbi:MAG: gamma carbonic anhydrase family protein [Anaplasmataceae bacterium]|nr:gamma carbonic anhydrase family protein [Anaplasmataceae bacterium]